jgi:hypothetical protein
MIYFKRLLFIFILSGRDKIKKTLNMDEVATVVMGTVEQ